MKIDRLTWQLHIIVLAICFKEQTRHARMHPARQGGIVSYALRARHTAELRESIR